VCEGGSQGADAPGVSIEVPGFDDPLQEPSACIALSIFAHALVLLALQHHTHPGADLTRGAILGMRTLLARPAERDPTAHEAVLTTRARAPLTDGTDAWV